MVARPGGGWPGDPASAQTAVASEPEVVARLAGSARSLGELTARVSVCRACPRLVGWREDVAAEKRAAFRDEPYWGRPVTGWGDPQARIVIVGLAPAAHGGNRTGRIFTGDRSGDWLFAALHRAGLARLPISVSASDGQELLGAWMLAAVRCAPPANKPTPGERETCAPWMRRELELLQPTMRVVIALGGFAWSTVWATLPALGFQVPKPRPAFGHLREVAVNEGLRVIGSYHPSQQNTFTGKLTEKMLDAVFVRATEQQADRTSPAPAFGPPADTSGIGNSHP